MKTISHLCNIMIWVLINVNHISFIQHYDRGLINVNHISSIQHYVMGLINLNHISFIQHYDMGLINVNHISFIQHYDMGLINLSLKFGTRRQFLDFKPCLLAICVTIETVKFE